MEAHSSTKDCDVQPIASHNVTTQSQEKRKRKTLGTYCAAVSCHNSRRNCKLSMFRFPKDEGRCKKWVQNTRREDIRHLSVQKLYSYELCSNHFEESQFTNKEKKNRLIRTAIPTLFNVPNPPPIVTPARSVRKKLKMAESIDIVHTDQNETSDTPRKKKLKRKLQTL